MRLAFHTVCLSPHQLPLVRCLVERLGADEVRYVADQPLGEDRRRMGWFAEGDARWTIEPGARKDETEKWVSDADLLVSSLRTPEIFSRRAKRNLPSFYMSERWFKPIGIFTFHAFGRTVIAQLPGWLRMMNPRYFRAARRMTAFLDSPLFTYLPIGPWAARDMRLARLLTGRFRRPANAFRPWCYFVAPSGTASDNCRPRTSDVKLRLLWVGRLIDWKRVDTIVRAVARCATGVTLTIVGDGPENPVLRALAEKLGIAERVLFLPSQPIGEIRGLMRSHDVYVLASNAQEGWGAALSEALTEGMVAFGTREAGASAAMLPPERLYRVGDDRTLAALLTASFRQDDFSEVARKRRREAFAQGKWSAARAADTWQTLLSGPVGN